MKCPFCNTKINKNNHSCASSKHRFGILNLTKEEMLETVDE